jgi:UPF0271 protein
MVERQMVTSITGKEITIPVDTICIHGDTENAVAIARAVRAALETNGIQVRPFSTASG